MGSFANTVFSLLLGWVRSAVQSLWTMVSSEGGGALAWLGEHWLGLAAALCILGTVVDVVVYLIRWRPYKVWASFFRRLRGRAEKDAPAAPQPDAPVRRMRREWVYPDGNTRTEEVYAEPDQPPEEDMAWMPEDAPAMAQRFDAAPAAEVGYRRRFARSQLPEEVSASDLERLRYQTETPAPMAEPAGLEDYPPPREARQEAPEPISRQPQEEAEDAVGRSRRMLRRVAALPKSFLMDTGEDELQLRYQPAQPAVDHKQAYHEPVYPPAWRPPAEAGAARREEQA